MNDLLVRMGLNFEIVWELCFDGAANMSDQISRVQNEFLKFNPNLFSFIAQIIHWTQLCVTLLKM